MRGAKALRKEKEETHVHVYSGETAWLILEPTERQPKGALGTEYAYGSLEVSQNIVGRGWCMSGLGFPGLVNTDQSMTGKWPPPLVCRLAPQN